MTDNPDLPSVDWRECRRRMSCIICWAETEGRCPLCGLAICERDLRLHTNPEVESHCFPWRVESLPHCGRVLTATRDIAPFELLISDTALVLAPNDLPVCLGCLDEVRGDSVEVTPTVLRYFQSVWEQIIMSIFASTLRIRVMSYCH